MNECKLRSAEGVRHNTPFSLHLLSQAGAARKLNTQLNNVLQLREL